METTALRQLLRSFCSNLPWNYAVLWKLLRHESQMILSWEDGCCDYPKLGETVEILPEDIYSNGGNETSPSNGLMGANMSHLRYTLGEGVVGKVADTGNHLWFSYDYDCPEEWLLQLASGIKTVVLVPVLPHGVIQLGSLELISEDLAMVAYIKDIFTLHDYGGYAVPFASEKDIQSRSSSIALMSGLMENLDGPPASTVGYVKSEYSVPLINFQYASGQEDPSGAFGKVSENKTGFSPVGLEDVSKSLSQSIDYSNLEMMESKLFEFSCLEEELEAYEVAMNSYRAGCSAEQPFEDQTSSITSHANSINFLSFPEDCELHKALGPTFQRHDGEYSLGSLFSVDNNTHSSPGLIYNRANRIESAWFGKGGDSQFLSEAVVANRYSGSDDSIPRSHVAPACVTKGIDEFTPASAQASFESKQGNNNTQPRKGTKLPSASKRRTKPGGDNQRPRPRDRQLIQERIKELRELVPNGEKCSIDGLLGQTIDHMLYLRNVTNQAEKLRQWVHHEVAARKDLRSSKTNDNSQNGKTRAFEFGSNEYLLCPIIVEDLPYPGHMLIEMLCNEHGLFLEIAQVIRSLDLTILKGVRESRSNDSWAHFIVEASKGFDRVDIFWPLMHLLQRTRNPISSKI